MNDIFEKKGISVDDDNLPIPDQLTAAFNELICIPNLVQLINGNMGLSDVQTGEADIETRLKNKEKMVSIYPDTLRMSRKCICEGKVLPLKLQAKTFETFQLLDGLGEIFNKSKEFINSSKSLYLYGGPGNGKTHLLAASYNQAVKECPKCCCYYNVEDLVCFKRCEYQTKEDVESEAINKIMKYQLVYLDDFVIKSDSYKYSSFFYRLFNKALENGKPRFFITANQSIKSIAVKMEDRIASRIAELCGKENIIINLGEDQRVK
jgi:DNA replication protein DnaC